MKTLESLIENQSYNMELFEVQEFVPIDIELNLDTSNKNIYEESMNQDNILVNLNIVFSEFSHVTVKKVVFMIKNNLYNEKSQNTDKPYYILKGALLLDKSVLPFISNYKFYICFNHKISKFVSSKAFTYDPVNRKFIEYENNVLLNIIRIRPMVKKIFATIMRENVQENLFRLANQHINKDKDYDLVFNIIFSSLPMHRYVDKKVSQRLLEGFMVDFFHSLVSNFNTYFQKDICFDKSLNIQNNMSSLLFYENINFKDHLKNLINSALDLDYSDNFKDILADYNDINTPERYKSDSYEDFDPDTLIDFEMKKDIHFLNNFCREGSKSPEASENSNGQDSDGESDISRKTQLTAESGITNSLRRSFRRNNGGSEISSVRSSFRSFLPRQDSQKNMLNKKSVRGSSPDNHSKAESVGTFSTCSSVIDGAKEVDDMVNIDFLSNQRSLLRKKATIIYKKEKNASKLIPDVVKKFREENIENSLDDFIVSIKDASEFKRFFTSRIEIFEKVLFEIIKGLKILKNSSIEDLKTLFVDIKTVNSEYSIEEEGITLLFKNKTNEFIIKSKESCIFTVYKNKESSFYITSKNSSSDFYTTGCHEDYLYTSIKRKKFDDLNKDSVAIFYFESDSKKIYLVKIEKDQLREFQA